MKKNDIITHLLFAFPKIFFVLQAHENRQDKAITAKGKIKVGATLTLTFFHFLTLWLIESIIEAEGKCERPYLKEIFFWKHKGRPKNLFEETVMNRLIAAGLIESKAMEGYRQQDVVTLTEKGRTLLKTVEEERRKNIEAIISLLDISDPTYYQNLVDVFNKVAEAAWETVGEKAKESLSNRKSRNKGKNNPAAIKGRRRIAPCTS